MSGMQLIDTNALLNVRNVRKVTEYDEGGWGVSYNAVPVEAVKAAHVIDAVPVVRCKDCVCSSMSNGRLICSRIAETTDRYFRGKAEIVMPDDYCSHGARLTEVRKDDNA